MALKRGRAVAAPSRFPTAIFRRILWGAGIVILVLLAVLTGAGAFLTYRITTAHNEIENVTPASYLLPSFESLSFRDLQGGEHEGWLLVGLKGAPAIILCPPYDSNRAELLYLGVVLQANHFNVYLFNFDGPGSGSKFSNLGVHEASVAQAAINMITRQPGINSHRVGVYGATIGGYAALVAAEKDPRVQALAVDSVYERPVQMFDVQVDHLLGGTGALFRFISSAEFRMLNWGTSVPPSRADLAKLSKRPMLFLAGEDVPRLQAITQDLYRVAPEPKRLLMIEHTEVNLASDSEKKDYENQILNFFLQNLPLRVD